MLISSCVDCKIWPKWPLYLASHLLPLSLFISNCICSVVLIRKENSNRSRRTRIGLYNKLSLFKGVIRYFHIFFATFALAFGSCSIAWNQLNKWILPENRQSIRKSRINYLFSIRSFHLPYCSKVRVARVRRNHQNCFNA